jgi:RNA recognition motif-containing protein
VIPPRSSLPIDRDDRLAAMEIVAYRNFSFPRATRILICILQVMYLRMGHGNENLPCDYAYIEFTNQFSVPTALQNNGIEFKGRRLRYGGGSFSWIE